LGTLSIVLEDLNWRGLWNVDKQTLSTIQNESNIALKKGKAQTHIIYLLVNSSFKPIYDQCDRSN
jgi:hypothetical protein